MSIAILKSISLVFTGVLGIWGIYLEHGSLKGLSGKTKVLIAGILVSSVIGVAATTLEQYEKLKSEIALEHKWTNNFNQLSNVSDKINSTNTTTSEVLGDIKTTASDLEEVYHRVNSINMQLQKSIALQKDLQQKALFDLNPIHEGGVGIELTFVVPIKEPGFQKLANHLKERAVEAVNESLAELDTNKPWELNKRLLQNGVFISNTFTAYPTFDESRVFSISSISFNEEDVGISVPKRVGALVEGSGFIDVSFLAKTSEQKSWSDSSRGTLLDFTLSNPSKRIYSLDFENSVFKFTNSFQRQKARIKTVSSYFQLLNSNVHVRDRRCSDCELLGRSIPILVEARLFFKSSGLNFPQVIMREFTHTVLRQEHEFPIFESVVNEIK